MNTNPFHGVSDLGIRLLAFLFVASVLLMTIAWTSQRLTRRMSAAHRFGIWHAAFLSLLIMPLAALCLPQVPLGWLAAASPTTNPTMANSGHFDARMTSPPNTHRPVGEQAVSSNDRPAKFENETTRLRPIANQPLEAGTSPTIDSKTLSPPSTTKTNRRAANLWAPLLMATWFIGGLVLLTRLVASCLAVSRMAKRSTSFTGAAISDKPRKLVEQLCFSKRLNSNIPLGLSDEISVPVTTGMFRSQILLPAAAIQWTPVRLGMVLKHEMAHVERRDVFWQIWAALAKCLYWFQPMVWIGERKMQLERERACDDRVIDLDENPSEYAGMLLEIAAELSGRRLRSCGALSMAQKTDRSTP